MDTRPADRRRICLSADLDSGGAGRRFRFVADGRERSAFVIRYDGVLYGYINECAHMALELDWSPGVFFDIDGRYLMCATHGALYQPDSGSCAGGPCQDRGLEPVGVSERDGVVWLDEAGDVVLWERCHGENAR